MKVPHASDTHSRLVVVVVVVHRSDSALFVGFRISAYGCLRMFGCRFPDATDPGPDATDPGLDLVIIVVRFRLDPELGAPGWE